MKTYHLVVLLAVSVIIASCGNAKKPLAERNQLTKEISDMEKALLANDEPNADLADEMISAYLEYAEKYPEDTVTPEYLFKASEIAMNFGRATEAIEFLTRIEEDYKKYDKYPAVIFMKAFIYENNLDDINKAADYYTIFVEKYPNHKLAKDAEAALTYLGLDDEELIKLFEENSKTQN
jgi:tetratricopeptide (TPR) repeat protein